MIECNISTSIQFNTSVEYYLKTLGNTTNSTTEETDTYDGYGAMQFIIITVTVYAAMGVFCTLINNIRRKPTKGYNLTNQDEAVIKYLKQEKSLKLQGFHMQLQSLRSKYTEMVRQYEEKMKLLEIQKELERMDQGSPPMKRARQTRRLSLFNIHQGIKGKFGGGRKRQSVDHTVGKMGFSLLHLMSTSKPASLAETDEEIPSQRDSVVSDIDHDKFDKVVDVKDIGPENDSTKDSSETCVVDIEDRPTKNKSSTESIETEMLLPPITSQLSESV